MASYAGPKYIPSGYPKCMDCGKTMKPQYDEISKKITGYLWQCGCMLKNMVVSVG